MSTHLVPGFTAPADGDLTEVIVADRTLAVTVADGQVYAIDDTCSHAQCSLALGEVEGRSVVCPCHAGTFDLATGAVLSGPPKTALRTYPARLVDGGLELELPA